MRLTIDPKVDYAFKWLFGREARPASLIAILHAVLNLPPDEQIVEIQLLNPFTLKMALDDKLSILDIKARDQSGRLFNIEMQMVGFPALPQRILYYWSKLYTEQLQAGEDYGTLRPTISICFVDGVIFPGKSDYHSCFRLTEGESGVAFTDDIQIHLLELPKFHKTASELSTALDGWLYLLKHGGEAEVGEWPGLIDWPELRQAMEELRMLTELDIQKEIYEGREKARRDERAKMQGALKQGLEQGLEQGMVRGALIGRIEAYQELLGLQRTPRADLQPMSVEELQRMADELRQQLGR